MIGEEVRLSGVAMLERVEQASDDGYVPASGGELAQLALLCRHGLVARKLVPAFRDTAGAALWAGRVAYNLTDAGRAQIEKGGE